MFADKIHPIIPEFSGVNKKCPTKVCFSETVATEVFAFGRSKNDLLLNLYTNRLSNYPKTPLQKVFLKGRTTVEEREKELSASRMHYLLSFINHKMPLFIER